MDIACNIQLNDKITDKKLRINKMAKFNQR
jgi:hypothetical protein